MVEAALDHTLPLLAPWTGPHDGAPAFDAVRVGDFEPALMAGMAEQRAEIAAIVETSEAPTFDNTIAALERSGRALNRAGAIYGVWASTLNDKAMQAVEQAMSPVFAAFDDEIIQNWQACFAAVAAVFQALDDLEHRADHTGAEKADVRGLSPLRPARRGAGRGRTRRRGMGEINQRLATLMHQPSARTSWRTRKDRG